MIRPRALLVRVAHVVRLLLPLTLIAPLLRWRVRRMIANPAVLASAVEQMEFLLGATDRAGTVPAASGRYVERQMWRAELRWHPKAITRQRVEGIANLLAARDEGRGVLLNFMHHGQYDGAFASVHRAGVRVHVMAGVAMLLPDADPVIKQHLRIVAQGGELVSAGIGTTGVVELLNAGHVVAVASDVPGSAPLTFAGRGVLGSSGAARAATVAGAPVVMMTAHHDDGAIHLELSPPLYPVDFDSVEDLLEAMVRHHEKAVLDWPEASDIPAACWGSPTAKG